MRIPSILVWLALLCAPAPTIGSAAVKLRHALDLLHKIGEVIAEPAVAADLAIVFATSDEYGTRKTVDSLVEHTGANVQEWRAARVVQHATGTPGVRGSFVVLPACVNGIRVGLAGEQAKMVCDPGMEILKRKNCRVVSVGSNGDAAFERDIHRLAPECYIETWDGTLVGTRQHLRSQLPDFINFIPHNFGAESWKESTVRTVSTLKIDCEGCELTVLPAWIEHVCTEMLLVEVHNYNGTKVAAMLQKVTTAGYRVLYGEDNPRCGKITGMRCTEVAFSRRDPCPTSNSSPWSRSKHPNEGIGNAPRSARARWPRPRAPSVPVPLPPAAAATLGASSESEPFKPFKEALAPKDRDDAALTQEAEIEMPIAWLFILGVLLVCCCLCRWCWKRRRCGRADGDGDARLTLPDGGGDGGDDEAVCTEAKANALARTIVRIVGYEPLATGRLEYSGLDSSGNELTLDRDDLLAAGDESAQMVRAYERRYPPPWVPETSLSRRRASVTHASKSVSPAG